jgi:muconolactone D-isomerase
MEFLVQIAVDLPGDMDPARREALLADELRRGIELREAGTIREIWRVPGRLANVGVWTAPDADALHDALASLPVFRFARADVTALATHPLMREREPRPRR